MQLGASMIVLALGLIASVIVIKRRWQKRHTTLADQPTATSRKKKSHSAQQPLQMISDDARANIKAERQRKASDKRKKFKVLK